MPTILPFADALATVLSHARALAELETETLALDNAAGRVVAKAVTTPRDQPPFDRATRDGYAVRADDIRHTLKVVGQIRAGESWRGEPLRENDAIEIMTGAPLPAGADAVVMIEHTTFSQNMLSVDTTRTLRAGENVVPRGAEALAGQMVLPAGRVLHAAEIAVAASCGAAKVEVFRKPKVAILATGDELVELGEREADQLAEAEIYNSNSYSLAALVRSAGGEPARLPIARDNRADLDARLADATEHDLLLLSGGVSMGKYDLVEEALAARGAEFFFTGTLIQPGKPLVFGKLTNGPYFFGLPGNPVSTQVCFHLFVAPMLRALAGGTQIEPMFAEATLEHEVKAGPQVLRFLPAELTSAWDHATVKLVGWQGSGDVAANARGNCYCVLPIGQDLKAGDGVRVLLR